MATHDLLRTAYSPRRIAKRPNSATVAERPRLEGLSVGLTSAIAAVLLVYSAIALANPVLAQTIGIGVLLVVLVCACWKRAKSPLRVRRP